MSTTITSKRLSAVLAFIIAFAVAAVMAISPAAFAVEAVTAPKVGNIDPNTRGSLTVHKYTSPVKTADLHNGSELEDTVLPDGKNKLSGVKFTLYPVNNLDLTTQAGWDTLKKITDGIKATTVTISADGTLTGAPTNVQRADNGTEQATKDGATKFDNLAVGAYIVVETDNSQATINKGGNAEPIKVIRKVDPFIVTIPFPTTKDTSGNVVKGAQDGWLYNVHVYPKNDVSEDLSKVLTTTQDAHLITGDGELQWTMSVPIPVTNKNFDEFAIHDTLEKGTLLSTVNVPALKIGTSTSLVVTTDYTVAGGVAGTNKVTIEFTSAGLTKINAHKGEKITVDLYVSTPKGKVADNVIANSDYDFEYSFEGEPGKTKTPPPTTGDPTPKAYFGNYKLQKKSKIGDTPLEGAKFELYSTQQDANAGTNKLNAGELKSNAQGIVEINGLYRGKTSADDTKSYWVKEIEAPAGFKLNETPQKIVVTKDTGTGNWDGQFDNEPRKTTDVPDLPLTGAAGKVLLTLGGIAIVMLAAGTVLATRRRKA